MTVPIPTFSMPQPMTLGAKIEQDRLKSCQMIKSYCEMGIRRIKNFQYFPVVSEAHGVVLLVLSFVLLTTPLLAKLVGSRSLHQANNGIFTDSLRVTIPRAITVAACGVYSLRFVCFILFVVVLDSLFKNPVFL